MHSFERCGSPYLSSLHEQAATEMCMRLHKCQQRLLGKRWRIRKEGTGMQRGDTGDGVAEWDFYLIEERQGSTDACWRVCI